MGWLVAEALFWAMLNRPPDVVLFRKAMLLLEVVRTASSLLLLLKSI